MNMTQIYVYSVHTSIESLVCILAEKAYVSGKTVYIYSPLDDRVKAYDQMIWTFKKISFIPHLIEGEENFEESPIVLSSKFSDFSQKCNFVFVIDDYEFKNSFKLNDRIVFFLHQSDSINIAKMRDLIHSLNSSEFEVKVFKENKNLKWEESVL